MVFWFDIVQLNDWKLLDNAIDILCPFERKISWNAYLFARVKSSIDCSSLFLSPHLWACIFLFNSHISRIQWKSLRVADLKRTLSFLGFTQTDFSYLSYIEMKYIFNMWLQSLPFPNLQHFYCISLFFYLSCWLLFYCYSALSLKLQTLWDFF